MTTANAICITNCKVEVVQIQSATDNQCWVSTDCGRTRTTFATYTSAKQCVDEFVKKNANQAVVRVYDYVAKSHYAICDGVRGGTFADEVDADGVGANWFFVPDAK